MAVAVMIALKPAEGAAESQAIPELYETKLSKLGVGEIEEVGEVESEYFHPMVPPFEPCMTSRYVELAARACPSEAAVGFASA